MSAIYEVTNPETVKSLLDKVHDSQIALPHFQRSFVWSLDKTRSLLVSMMLGYPAGAMLAIRLDSTNKSMMFKLRSIDKAPPLKKKVQLQLVLDGQQRLTSLYQALYGVGEYRHYLNFQKLFLDSHEVESSLISLRVGNKKDKEKIDQYSHLDYQAEHLIMPLEILKGGAAAYGKWYLKVLQKRPQGQYEELEELFEGMEHELVSPLLDYEFPWIVLRSNTPDEAVASVFDVINNTGQRLSIFDLVNARTWKSGEKTLQDKWDEAMDSVEEGDSLLGEYDIDPVYVLNVCALLATINSGTKQRRDPACGRGEILRLNKREIELHWKDAIWGLNRALVLLVTDTGLLSKKWLPYETVLIPMAAVLAKHRNTKGSVAQGEIVEKVKRWYWCTCLSGEYDQGAIAKAARDFKQMLEWIDGKNEPKVVSVFSVNEIKSRLRHITPKNGAVYKALICIICRNRPLDFLNLQPITMSSLRQSKNDDHHIFPKGFFGTAKKVPSSVDTILNRTLIDAKSNKELGKTAPSKYFEKMKQRAKPTTFKRLLKSHMINEEAQSSLLKDNYEEFLVARTEMFLDQIAEVTS